jgi:hypothetical protein
LPNEFFTSGARMTMERFAGVVSWSRRNGIGEITLLGGEPSLHPSFADMVALANAQGMKVRVVTNGAPRFRRLLSSGAIGPHNLSRVAVSLDTLDEAIQDEFRGPGAWHDAMATVALLGQREVPFDINVTAVKPVLGGLDAIVFTAGIGENSPEIRSRICAASAWLGIDMDPDANRARVPRISRSGSRVSAWVIPTNEELIIARHTGALLGLVGAARAS